MVTHLDSLAQRRGPLERRSLKSDIFNLLHQRIIAGEYSPGTWLRQSEIAEELEVSPTPVREALDQLVAEGLAQQVPYRGVRVPNMTHGEIADAYVLRLVLEVTVARVAAHNISAEQAKALRSLVQQTKDLLKPGDIRRYRQLNWQIHRLIASAGGNPLMARVHGIALNRFPDWMLYEDLLHKPDELQASLEGEYREHVALVEAIVSQDPKLAAEEAHKHLHSVGQEIVSSLGVPQHLLEEKEEQIGPLVCRVP